MRFETCGVESQGFLKHGRRIVPFAECLQRGRQVKPTHGIVRRHLHQLAIGRCSLFKLLALVVQITGRGEHFRLLFACLQRALNLRQGFFNLAIQMQRHGLPKELAGSRRRGGLRFWFQLHPRKASGNLSAV